MSSNLAVNYLKEYSPFKEKFLDKYINEKLPEAKKLGVISEDQLKRFLEMSKEGKGIRGALVTLGYEACGGTDKETILDTSIFMELFHAAILIHDDVEDSSPLRRKLPTIHKQYESFGKKLSVRTEYKHYGEAMAINVGDIGYFMSYEKLINSNFPVGLVNRALRIYSKYAIRLAHGQALDITTLPIEHINEEEILNILMSKSGEYTCILPLTIGATLAGVTEHKKLKAIEQYGTSLGWAFQILDDILGLFGDEAITGKPATSDLTEGKNTLLMLHLSKNGTAKQKAFQKRVFGNPNTTLEEIEKMRQILKDAGSYDYVINKGWKYVKEGKKYIPQITADKKYQDILESLLVFMMERIN